MARPLEKEKRARCLDILKTYSEIKNAKSLANDLDVDYTWVYAQAKKLGIPVVGNRCKSERNTTCNIRYFDNWSPNMAYILGFIFADGGIDNTTLSIQINSDDIGLLEFIRKEMSIKKPILIVPPDGSTRESCSLRVSSKILIKRLNELGVHQSKTFRDDPFPSIPDEMLGHFIRGYLDGDGSIKTRIGQKGYGECSISFIGTPNFIRGLHDNLVKKIGVTSKKLTIEHGKRAFWIHMGWAAFVDLNLIKSFIYPNDLEYCLERKRNVLFSWLDKKWAEYQSRKVMPVRRFYHTLGPSLNSVGGQSNCLTIPFFKESLAYVG